MKYQNSGFHLRQTFSMEYTKQAPGASIVPTATAAAPMQRPRRPHRDASASSFMSGLQGQLMSAAAQSAVLSWN
jgi:hypothetical protein